MRKFSFLAFISGLLFFSSCGKTPPKADEVAKRVMGDYCAEGYRLVLRPDSSFYSMRVTPGSMGSRPRTESCHGTYTLQFDSSTGEWLIAFRKGKAFSVALCEGNVTVWNKTVGWVSGDSSIILNEWFDKAPVEKGKCEI